MKKMRKGCPAIRVVMFPKDINGAGNIFGGVILSHIDVAGAVAARKICSHRIVTVSAKEVEFKKPVHVGDILTCWAEVTAVGTTSITTKVWVEADRDGKFVPVTEAEVVYVAVDKAGKSIPVASGLRDEKWRKKLGLSDGDKSAKKSGKAKSKSKGKTRRKCKSCGA